MTCPRCPTQLKKKDMLGHLWERHQLVLDGQRVREPWRVLEDWLVDYNLEKDPQVLLRCRELARRVDGEAGVARLHRLMLKGGAEDREVVAALLAQAKARKTSLCPHCYDAVKVAAPSEPDELDWQRNRLEAEGYRVELSERGLLPHLRVESPSEVLYDSREPGRWVTRLGGLGFVVMFVVPMVFVLLCGVTRGQYNPLLILLLAGMVGLVIVGFVYIFWPAPPPTAPRLLRAAWGYLVPSMVDEPLGPPEWNLLIGLVQASVEADYRPRTRLLGECCTAVGDTSKADPLAAVCLAELCRVYLPRLRDAESDVALFVADQLALVFAGKLSPHFVGAVCEQIGTSRQPWDRAALRRLQVLVASRGFGQGLSAEDMTDVGRVFPAAADVLGLDDRWHWSQLELLATMARTRGWERTGLASTVFEMTQAQADGEALLAESPNLLLCVRKQTLHVTTGGVWLLGQLLTTRPDDEEIIWNWSTAEQAYLIEIGKHVVRTKQKPRDVVIELKAWLKFYFAEFLPRLPAARRQISDAAQRVWQPLRTSCPDCHRPLVPCVGEVGIALR